MAIADALYRAAFPPQQTILQKMASNFLTPGQQQPSVGQAIAQTVFTPVNTLLALTGSVYLLNQTGKAYYLREHLIYKDIIKTYNSKVSKKNSSIADKIDFFYNFLDDIRQINGAQEDSKELIDLDAFIKRLNSSISFPLYTKIAGTLSNDFTVFKRNLENIRNYISSNKQQLQKYSQIYQKSEGKDSRFAELFYHVYYNPLNYQPHLNDSTQQPQQSTKSSEPREYASDNPDTEPTREQSDDTEPAQPSLSEKVKSNWASVTWLANFFGSSSSKPPAQNKQ
ncbi:hypothetical protein JST99_02055 [Candidatus Dependentiae bacterium]|nr:hypothetical protein [Candidatus Dependentiae bacterium]